MWYEKQLRHRTKFLFGVSVLPPLWNRIVNNKVRLLPVPYCHHPVPHTKGRNISLYNIKLPKSITPNTPHPVRYIKKPFWREDIFHTFYMSCPTEPFQFKNHLLLVAFQTIDACSWWSYLVLQKISLKRIWLSLIIHILYLNLNLLIITTSKA